MPRRPAKVTQADIARALRAAKEVGAHSVRQLARRTEPRRMSGSLMSQWREIR